MFDVIMIVIFTIAILGLMYFAFQPVMQTIERHQKERELKAKQNGKV